MPHKAGHRHNPSQKARNPHMDPSGMEDFKEITDFRDTIRFKRAFARHGVEIVRHRFDEGRGKFVFEEIETA